jgi:hypothetical protein
MAKSIKELKTFYHNDGPMDCNFPEGHYLIENDIEKVITDKIKELEKGCGGIPNASICNDEYNGERYPLCDYCKLKIQVLKELLEAK